MDVGVHLATASLFHSLEGNNVKKRETCWKSVEAGWDFSGRSASVLVSWNPPISFSVNSAAAPGISTTTISCLAAKAYILDHSSSRDSLTQDSGTTAR
jgi:hypothetical protein